MSYPDPRVNPQGFPYATDIFPNDTELSADGPAEWKRELPPFGPAFVPFIDGKASGMAQDVVTGFLDANNHTRGRPVGLAVDGSGALLIADDVGNTVWCVSSAGTGSAIKPAS